MNSSKIKKITFLLAGLILVGIFSAFLISKNLSDPKFTGPRIEFKNERIELGQVKVGPKAEGEFEFTNVGKDKLLIFGIQPACGCTGVVSDEKKEFLPGESGKIRFTFNTEGRVGPQEKTITVTSNDIKTPSKVLTFICNVIQ